MTTNPEPNPDMLIQSQQVTLTGTDWKVRRVLETIEIYARAYGLTVTIHTPSVTDATVGVTEQSQQNPRQHKRKADFKHAEDCSCFGDVVEHSRDCKNCTCQTED